MSLFVLVHFYEKDLKHHKTLLVVIVLQESKALGKTYSVVSFIDSIRDKDQKVITNVFSYAKRNDFAIYEKSIYDIIEKFNNGTYDSNYIIFFDEIFSCIEKGKLPIPIRNFISQLRKRRLYLVSTAQEWLEINVTFRRYVRYQIDCKLKSFRFLPFSICINEINDGYELKWSNIENEYVAPRLKTTVKKCNKYLGEAYDTLEVIDVDSAVTPAGQRIK